MFEDLKKDLEKEIQGIDFDALNTLKGKEDQWLDLRKGRFTASEFVRLMGYEDKIDFPDGAMTYSIEVALEVLTEDMRKKQFKGSEIEWGNKWEEEACEKFIEKTGIQVSKYGFEQEFIPKGQDIGATPDGIIYHKDSEHIEAGIETKCPDSKTHLFYLEKVNKTTFKSLLTKYYWQMQGQMYVTGASYWYFVSYDPSFKKEENKLFILKIERNEQDLAKFRRRLAKAIEIKNYYLKKYA